MEHKIVISGEGSAHPKLGVKKKNSVEENLKILNDMIESGKLSLDHAIAKTKSNGTLRGIFKCSEDEEMAAHVDALYDFVVAYKKRLVPDFDPSAPVQKVQKKAVGSPPVVEAAKSGRATCKISQEKIEKDELRVCLCVEIDQYVGCNSSLSHVSATTRPCWLRRAARNRHRHAIEQASRRWRGGRRGDSGRTRRKFDFHTGSSASGQRI